MTTPGPGGDRDPAVARAQALARLRALAAECGSAGWDGDGARPLDPASVSAAASLVGALPDDVPLPEFAPEPDGVVALDWLRSRDRMLSVSVGVTGKLAYAWLDGADRGHGVLTFDGANVPARLLGEIRGVTDDADTAVRVA